MNKRIPLSGLFCLLSLLLFFFGCAVAAPPSPRAPGWAQPVALEGADNFFRVSPELYRAAQPDKKAMRAYEKFGIRTVINLRALHSDDDEARGTRLILVHIPTGTRAVDSDATVVRALQAIRDAEKPVLVHCMHGADRTGLILAMYRIVEQGWTKEAALDEMRSGGFGFHSIWTHIPEYIENVDADSIRRALHWGRKSIFFDSRSFGLVPLDAFQWGKGGVVMEGKCSAGSPVTRGVPERSANVCLSQI